MTTSPSRIGIARYIRYSLRLRRVEYRVAEIPIFMIPILLTIPDASALVSLEFLEGFFIFFFLFALGDLVNCLTDRDLDAVCKPHLTEAVQGIGVRGVLMQAVGSGLAAAVLAAHLAWRLDRWSILGMTLAAVFVAQAYSAEPFRLKRRGLWQLTFYWLGLFAGPMILSALFFTDRPSSEVFAVALSYGLLQTGVILVNTAEDYPEDRQMGVRTAIVAVGPHRGVGLALVLTAAGSVALLATLAALCQVRHVAFWGWAGALAPPTLACLFVIRCFARLKREISGLSEVDTIAVLKKTGRLAPVWITSVALATLLAAMTLFLVR